MIRDMRIAVFGTGPVGRALAGGLLDRGHSVAVGTRTPEDPAAVARLADLPGVSVMAGRAYRAELPRYCQAVREIAADCGAVLIDHEARPRTAHHGSGRADQPVN